MRRQSEVLANLWRTLEQEGIEPMAPGADPSVPGANVQRRVVDNPSTASPTLVISLRRALIA
ncbi:MAG TPA: hypothetical protein VEE84_01440 [Burkholderiaceae bacterium]|nr:hypothetical protein [Burkholderiaceae bacterium]